MSLGRFSPAHVAALATATGVLLAACGSSEAGPVGDGPATTATEDGGTKNNGETDVDCGGPTAPKCADGKACGADTDCANAYCKADTKTCATPRPDDGAKNGDE